MIKDGNIKQSIFEKTFNLTGKTLQEKYIKDSASKEKIHFSFPDLFSDFTSNESVDNKFDINNQDIVPLKQTSILDEFSAEEINFINEYYDDNYFYKNDDIRLWDAILFQNDPNFLQFKVKHDLLGIFFFHFSLSVFSFMFFNIWIALFFIMVMIYELWSKSTAGFSHEESANDFISSKGLKLQNKKTTLLNNIYHLLKPKQENSTPESLQKLKVFLYKAHQQSLEKDIVPAYYSTSTFLKDYIYTHLPYKVGMNEGNYLSVYNYVHGILDYISTHEHELKQ